jgi:hypothetical protein
MAAGGVVRLLALAVLAGCAGPGRAPDLPPSWPYEVLADIPQPAGWQLAEPMRLIRIAGGSVRRAEGRLERGDGDDGLAAWRTGLVRLGWIPAGADRWRKGDERLVLRRRGAEWSITLGGAGQAD